MDIKKYLIPGGVMAVMLIIGLLVGYSFIPRALGGSTSGDWNVGGNLSVTGTTSLTGAVSLTAGISATTGSFSSTLAVTATTTLSGAFVAATSTLSVSNTGTTTPLTLQNLTAASSTAVQMLFKTYDINSKATSTGSILSTITNLGGLGTGGSSEMIFSVLNNGLLTERARLDNFGKLTTTSASTTNATATNFWSTTGNITTFSGTTGTFSSTLGVSGAFTASATSTLGGTASSVVVASTTDGFAIPLVIRGSGIQVKGSDSTSCYTISVANGSVISAATSTCH